MATIQSLIPLDQVIIGDRTRQDYGDLPGLMASILRFGLIQPIILSDSNELIAGGRRYFSHMALVEGGHEEFNQIWYVNKSCLSQDDLVQMELEENIQRENMKWFEYCLGVRKIHLLRIRRSAADGVLWTQEQTSILLGKSKTRVVQILPIAAELAVEPKSEIWKCESVSEALNWMFARKELIAKAKLASMAIGEGIQLSKLAPRYGQRKVSEILQKSNETPEQAQARIDQETAHVPFREIKINLADFYNEGNCIPWLELNQGKFDHIITDPPYAIDMDNLTVKKEIEDAHDVNENLSLMRAFVPAAYRAMKTKGYLVMFCDAMNFRFLHDLGMKAGFCVQRWPAVWCKNTGKNEAAQYNFTKNFELAVIMRKEGSTLAAHQSTSWQMIVKAGIDKDFDHAFAKPRDLWTWFIHAVSNPGEVLADPFTGSGSGVCSFIAAGRQWLASERYAVHTPEFLRNVSKTYIELFAGQKINPTIHYHQR